MSAKCSHTFSEEDSELQKQIGCMTGFFKMFDRHNLLGGRKFIGHHNKRKSSGNSLVHVTNPGADNVACSPQLVLEKNLSKSLSENRRISMESSRTSFSSSSCSSFSSVDCNKSTLQEPISFNQPTFPDKSVKKSPKSKTSEIGFLDVVKDSVCKEPQNLSVKTAYKEEFKQPVLSYRDSPRPMQLSKSMDGSYVIGIDGKSRSTLDLNESFRVLMKLKEGPWTFSETMEPSRPSFDAKQGPLNGTSRESHRFSYDGRENGKPASKLRELPRLSLDSRQSSMRSSNSTLKDLDRSSSNKERCFTPPNIQKELGNHKSAPCVVAKLMGLEAMPSLGSNHEEAVDVIKSCALNTSLHSSKDVGLHFDSPKSSYKDLTKSWVKNPEVISKPFSTTRYPIEPAPWKQKEKIHVPNNSLKQQPETVYSEIEKRLKELEFRHANKDLRALKQILDAMQAKRLLESKKNQERSPKSVTTRSDQNLGSTIPQKPPLSSSTKIINTTGAFESPIVIMKPSKSLNRFDASTTFIPLHGLSRLHRLRTSEPMDKKNVNGSNKLERDCTTPRTSPRINEKTEENVLKNRFRTEIGSSRLQQSSKEGNGGLEKSSNSVSPRLQQRKIEEERKTRSSVSNASSDSVKHHKLSSNKQSSESVSPRNKLRRRTTMSQQGDEMSQRSERNMSSKSQQDMEYTSAETNFTSSKQGSQSLSTSLVLKQKNSPVGLNEEASTIDVAPEQPSPISVLDASFYQDDLPALMLKRSPNKYKGVKLAKSDSFCESHQTSSKINQRKLESIENLLQKLEEFNSTPESTSTTDHIASLCETQKPVHRYISEILLASGLLMKNLSSAPMGLIPIQRHPSGHLINPDLFLVLEQTKASQLCKPESFHKSTFISDKLHRKLVFDVVNEVLVQKLGLQSRLPSGQQLLKDLCSEIDKLLAEALMAEGSDDDKNIIGEEVLRRSFEWNDYRRELPGFVLDIERLIFKDMIDELISGEASSMKYKCSRRRRQLFAK